MTKPPTAVEALWEAVNDLSKRIRKLEPRKRFVSYDNRVRAWYPGCGNVYASLYHEGGEWWYAKDVREALSQIINAMPNGVSCESLMRLRDMGEYDR